MGDVLSDVLTTQQKLSLFREHTGLVYTIKPFEEVVSVRLSDDGAALLISRYQREQTARGWKLLKKGKRLLSFAPSENGWKQTGYLDIWDDDFEPCLVTEIGRHKSVSESIEQTYWERDAFRWGNNRHPNDSWMRQLEGYGKGTVLDWRTP